MQRVEVAPKSITAKLQVLPIRRWAQKGIWVDQFWLHYSLSGRPKLLGRRAVNIAPSEDRQTQNSCSRAWIPDLPSQSLNLFIYNGDNDDYTSCWSTETTECKPLSTDSGTGQVLNKWEKYYYYCNFYYHLWLIPNGIGSFAQKLRMPDMNQELATGGPFGKRENQWCILYW